MSAYLRPLTLSEALALLGDGQARVAAGCTDLFPATEAQHLPGPILDITRVAELRGIAKDNDGWRIGAATTWTDLRQADLPPAFAALQQAAREVGSVQIQNAGTIGGNLCNASPAADGVPCLQVLDAAVELISAAGVRVLPLAGFLTGPRRTGLRPGEILTAVLVPAASASGSSAFLKLGARRHLVISIAMVAARLVLERGRIHSAAVSVGACGPVASRLTRLEAALRGQQAGTAPDFAAELVTAHLAPIDDIRGDAAYRGQVAVELVRRALCAALPGTGEVAA